MHASVCAAWLLAAAAHSRLLWPHSLLRERAVGAAFAGAHFFFGCERGVGTGLQPSRVLWRCTEAPTAAPDPVLQRLQWRQPSPVQLPGSRPRVFRIPRLVCGGLHALQPVTPLWLCLSPTWLLAHPHPPQQPSRGWPGCSLRARRPAAHLWPLLLPCSVMAAAVQVPLLPCMHVLHECAHCTAFRSNYITVAGGRGHECVGETRP
jgi:hypothetical protein